jgi:hypothetical protein
VNDDAVVILRGLREGDRVLLTPPKDGDAMPLVRLPGVPAPPPTVDNDTAGSRKLVAPARKS